MDIKVVSRRDIDLGTPPAGDPPAPTPAPAPAPAGDPPAPEPTPPPAPAGDPPTPPAGDPPAPPAPVDISAQLAEITGGKLKSVDEIKSLVSQMEEIGATKQQLETLVKALNPKDDYIKGLVAHYNETGEVQSYIQTVSTDLSAMTPEQVLRHKIEAENPGLSKPALEKLYTTELVQRYYADNDASPEDREIGQALLKREADAYIAKFNEKKAALLAKAPKLPEQETPEQAAERVRKANELVDNDPVTKDVLTQKAISLVDGFNYSVESMSDDLVNSAKDARLLFEAVVARDENGKPVLGEDGAPRLNLKKWYAMMAFAKDPEGFLNAHVQHGKTLGKAEALAARDNPSPGLTGDPAPPRPAGGDVLSAFAEKGTKVKR